MWVARWWDKLSDKRKYVWLSDNSSIKQQREEAKFDKAIALHEQIDAVRAHIQAGMVDKNQRRRMIATACYLIDVLCLRVGDEKEADEADTVGATTLRPEHVTLLPDGVAEFKFLGKDSVPWHKELALPPLVYETMEELIREARPSRTAGNGDESHPTRDLPQIFPDIGSRHINTFLSRAQKSLSAKVFRTHHATRTVQESLQSCGVRADSPEYAKWEAVATANLGAAILCNHTKKDTGNWKARKLRYEERIAKAQERLERYRGQLTDRKEALQVLQVEAASKRAIAQARLDKIDPESESQREKTRLEKAQAYLQRTVERYDKRLARARSLIETAKARVQRTRDGIGKIEAQMELANHKRTWNLGTSLKSYIDPRVYVRWGEQVEYDVLEKYYPKTLRRKFAWAKSSDGEPEEIAG
jgi:DNA topoisomerase-1